MRIDILTTQHRGRDKTQNFWQSYGWTPVYHDNTDQPPGAGRNRILQEFYNSDRTWLCMADDDIVLDVQRGRSREFLYNPRSLLDAISPEITSFGVMNNIHHRVDITLNNPVVQNNWVFVRNYWIGCLVFHKRTGQTYWNHDSDVLEDMDWCIQQLMDNQRIATCMNLVMKQLDSKSTIFSNQHQRREKYIAAKQRIAHSYPDITLTPQNKLIKTRLINRYWPISPAWSSVPDIGPALTVPFEGPRQ